MHAHELVEVIFTKLSLAYGRDFLIRWEGLDIAMVKADWVHELNGISPESVRHALRNLPASKPPTVFEFRNIAVSAPTSFGKSFVIDAFIKIRKPKNVIIIVPTIALTDETRRR